MKGNTTARRDWWPALLLALGFTVSAVATYGVAWALGAALLGDLRSSWLVPAVAATVLATLVVADAGLFGLRTPTWRRQTPRWFAYRYGERRAALYWGLDAGLVFTTFRVSSLSWAALIVALLGLVPWWVGAAYALGFVVPELVFNLVLPRRRDPSGATDPEPNWAVEAIANARRGLHPVSLAALTVGSGIVALMAFGG